MPESEERATSFGTIANDYDRLRPSPSPDAVAWLMPADCRVIVDLAAGTGIFTRAVEGRAEHVIAVEPDDRMRAVLAARSPDVEALAGRGEAIPLEDRVADAVFVSSAWHWMDPERAATEIARVLRPGGRFGVIWTSRDREVDWLRELEAVVRPFRFEHERALDPCTRDHRRHREVTLPEADLFTNIASASFAYELQYRIDDVVAMFGTYSGVITASADARHEALGQARALLEERFPGVEEIDVPMRSWCWRADRRPD